MLSSRELLAELRVRIAAHARPDLRTPIARLLLSKAEGDGPDYSLTEPLLVVLAQGARRLVLGEQEFVHRAGQLLVIAAELPVTGRSLAATPRHPALGLGLLLRPAAVAALLPDTAPAGRLRTGIAITTGPADPELLDALVRMVRLLGSPADLPVLAPLVEREILWRLLTGPQGGAVRDIGLTESGLSRVCRATRWIRDNYARPMRVEELARLAGMSPSAFHRHFRAVTAMSPLQFQKRIRLQAARSLLAAQPGDVAGAGHLVGYDSPTQFNREYRRLFGAPPGQDAARIRAAVTPPGTRFLP